MRCGEACLKCGLVMVKRRYFDWRVVLAVGGKVGSTTTASVWDIMSFWQVRKGQGKEVAITFRWL